jgi:tetratricopeptide (TPR) repeat protein
MDTSIHETALGAMDTKQMQDLLQAATEAKSAGQYEKALELYEQLLVLKEEEFGLEHRDVADVLTLLADMSADEFNDYAKALEYNKRALAIRIKTFGENNENTANSLNRIAADYFYLKDYPKAKEYCEMALEVYIEGVTIYANFCQKKFS